MKRITLTFASKCAWRGIYLGLADPRGNDPEAWPRRGTIQLARLTVDPHDGVTPELSGAFPIGIRRTCSGSVRPRLFEFRVRLPVVRWATARTPSNWRRPAWAWRVTYQISSRFWHRVDGRYCNRKAS